MSPETLSMWVQTTRTLLGSQTSQAKPSVTVAGHRRNVKPFWAKFHNQTWIPLSPSYYQPATAPTPPRGSQQDRKKPPPESLAFSLHPYKIQDDGNSTSDNRTDALFPTDLLETYWCGCGRPGRLGRRHHRQPHGKPLRQGKVAWVRLYL